MDKYIKILEGASQLFLRYGAKSVTMDDVSKHLGISKKTLYTVVSNKADLVLKTLTASLKQDNTVIDQIVSESKDAVDEMIKMSEYILGRLEGLNPSLMFDLEKYYPSSWRLFEQHQNETVQSIIFNNLKRGKEEGLYRSDLNEAVIAHLYIHKSEVIIEKELSIALNQTPKEMYAAFIKYHIKGIVSATGDELFQKYLNEQKQ